MAGPSLLLFDLGSVFGARPAVGNVAHVPTTARNFSEVFGNRIAVLLVPRTQDDDRVEAACVAGTSRHERLQWPWWRCSPSTQRIESPVAIRSARDSEYLLLRARTNPRRKASELAGSPGTSSVVGNGIGSLHFPTSPPVQCSRRAPVLNQRAVTWFRAVAQYVQLYDPWPVAHRPCTGHRRERPAASASDPAPLA
jgi:hypothetical protein